MHVLQLHSSTIKKESINGDLAKKRVVLFASDTDMWYIQGSSSSLQYAREQESENKISLLWLLTSRRRVPAWHSDHVYGGSHLDVVVT